MRPQTRTGAARRPLRLATAAVALPLTLLATACGGTEAAGGGDAGEPRPGGTLAVGLNTSLACADPHQNSSNVTIFVARQIADSLTDQDPETGEITPWLAESWEVSESADSYTFHLREGVTFGDGTPLNAEAVAANFETIADLGPGVTPLASTYLDGYAGSEVVDEHTVTVTFDHSNVQFLQGTATITLGILAPATLERTPEERCAGELIGAGPFVIDGYQPEQRITLQRRDGYDWASPVLEHTGEAYVETVDFDVVPEAGVRAGQLRNGELHIDTIPLTEDVPGFEGNGFGVVGRPYPGVGVNLIPNLRRPLAGETAVRRAIQLGVDREEIVSGVLTEYDRVAENVITSATPFFEPLDGIAHDPGRAVELLEDDGWLPGADGVREKDEQRLELLALYHAGRQAGPMMELVQSQLREIGIDLQIRLLAPAELADAEASGEWDLWYSPFHRAEADSARAVFGFTGRNQNRVEEARPVDELLQEQSGEADPERRQELITEATQELVDEAYAIPLYELAGVMTHREGVQGFHFEASSRLSLYDVWLDE
ncbi:ABC transporter substrate-binding protein [Streptomyces radicis]|uniref:ABC transporter substrate-binding protein n=1 Tax=Streptomyces radicis TaxID=1750517 RepID=A0A3A9VVN2_9ACTN|nr:ABC transporter substrate-binding protein [Streptomyces radicis]RKN04592.1 ABC transporter substrate-binding protein [Streptomyces radicis]RKN15549.1 ABC transporter substrate-binding protein [Streptomyces radicis]